MRPTLVLASLFALSVTGAVNAAPAARPGAVRFDPIAFFTGRLVGDGRLHTMLSSTVATHVESRGDMRGRVLHLVQVVHEGDKPVRTREWLMHEGAPDHYTGTLSDADGPVTAETQGNRLHIAYAMKGGLTVDEWLTLSADGRRAANTMKVRKLGLTVASLTEDIRKDG